MSFEAKLSDNGAEVLLFHEGDDEPETMPVEEFVEIYGTSIIDNYVSAIEMEIFLITKPDQFSISQYYDALINTTYKHGNLAKIIGMRAGTVDGSENARKAAKAYFNGDDRKIVTEIYVRRKDFHTSLNVLNYWSARLGLGIIPSAKDGPVPKGKISIEEFSNLMWSKKHFRSKLRHLAEKYCKKGVLLSLDEIIAEALASYRK